MDPYIVSGITAVVTTLVGVVGFLWRETRRLQTEEADCRERVSQLSAEVWSLNSRLEQVVWAGVEDPNGQVVIDANSGLILEWSPGATILFHWTAREMLGKPITRILPERFRQQHAEAIERVRASGGLPRHGPFSFLGLTKEGTEFPIEIRLSGWSVGGQKIFAASVRHRIPDAGEPKTVAEGRK